MMVDAQTGRETLGVANENQIRLRVPFCATQSRDSSHSAMPLGMPCDPDVG